MRLANQDLSSTSGIFCARDVADRVEGTRVRGPQRAPTKQHDSGHQRREREESVRLGRQRRRQVPAQDVSIDVYNSSEWYSTVVPTSAAVLKNDNSIGSEDVLCTRARSKRSSVVQRSGRLLRSVAGTAASHITCLIRCGSRLVLYETCCAPYVGVPR